jgi:hypothetical protein
LGLAVELKFVRKERTTVRVWRVQAVEVGDWCNRSGWKLKKREQSECREEFELVFGSS